MAIYIAGAVDWQPSDLLGLPSLYSRLNTRHKRAKPNRLRPLFFLSWIRLIHVGCGGSWEFDLIPMLGLSSMTGSVNRGAGQRSSILKGWPFV